MSAQDTPAELAAATRHQVTERKLKADGSVREYPCELEHRATGLMVVRFDVLEPAAFRAPIVIPRGTASFGYFWKSKPYNLYRMFAPGGDLLAHRFDAVASVRFDETSVAYRDLVLDWWALADDTLIEEDRDEFDELVAAGTLTAKDAARAESAALAVHSRYRHIIEDVAVLARRLGIE